MNIGTKDQISEEIKLILSTKRLSQNELAEKIGISPSQLINMKSPDKWERVSDKLWQVATLFFNKGKEWKTIETFNFQDIITLCYDAQSNKRLLAVAGRSGLGKTTALKHYTRQNSNAYYVLTDYLQKSKEFFKSIAIALGIDIEGNARKILQAIVDRINTLENPVIILDDAGKLNDSNYRNIQLLFDATEGRAGIVLGGTLHLKQYIERMTQKEKMGFDELERRIEYWMVLKAPRKEEIESLCNNNSVSDKDCINYLYNTCKEFGTIKTLITSARRFSDSITVDLLVKVRGN
jgi:DNA transposition AAA+ family ATPase